MGAWDVDAFANDEASDWIAGVDPGRGYRQLHEVLDRVRPGVDVTVGQRAVAAAAIIALSRGRSYATPPEVISLLARLGPPASDEDADRAAAALRLLLHEPNELRDLWQEADASAEWGRDVAELIDGLKQPPLDLPTWFEEPLELRQCASESSAHSSSPTSTETSGQSPPWWRAEPGTAGTWGIDGFANQEAIDWIRCLDPTRGYSQLRDALGAVQRDVATPVAQRAVAAAAIVAISRGAIYSDTPGLDPFLGRVGQPPSDEDAKQALAALRVLRDEPNELRRFWQESSQGADWRRDMADLIDQLPLRPELTVWFEEPLRPQPTDVHLGDVYELTLSDGRLSYAQVAAASGHHLWLTRVLSGTFDQRPEIEEIVRLASAPERLVRIVQGITAFPRVTNVPPPARFAEGYPCLATDGSVVLPDGCVLGGREFSRQHSDLDLGQLPPCRESRATDLVQMVERGPTRRLR